MDSRWSLEKGIKSSKEYHTLSYDLSWRLLIGVNNQYRGKAVEEYKMNLSKKKEKRNATSGGLAFGWNLPDHVGCTFLFRLGNYPFPQWKKK